MSVSATTTATTTSAALLARLREAPHVAAAGPAEQRLRDWLSGLAPGPSAAIGDLLAHPVARDILIGIVEFSPYLFDLVRADPERLIRLLNCDPDSHLETLIPVTAREVLAAGGEAEVMLALRRMKAEAALLIALCDIGGTGGPPARGALCGRGR